MNYFEVSGLQFKRFAYELDGGKVIVRFTYEHLKHCAYVYSVEDNEESRLQELPASILLYFILAPNGLYSKYDIIESIWGPGRFTDTLSHHLMIIRNSAKGKINIQARDKHVQYEHTNNLIDYDIATLYVNQYVDKDLAKPPPNFLDDKKRIEKREKLKKAFNKFNTKKTQLKLKVLSFCLVLLVGFTSLYKYHLSPLMIQSYNNVVYSQGANHSLEINVNGFAYINSNVGVTSIYTQKFSEPAAKAIFSFEGKVSAIELTDNYIFYALHNPMFCEIWKLKIDNHMRLVNNEKITSCKNYYQTSIEYDSKRDVVLFREYEHEFKHYFIRGVYVKDGTEVESVESPKFKYGFRFELSPDSNKIIVVQDDAVFRSKLVIMDYPEAKGTFKTFYKNNKAIDSISWTRDYGVLISDGDGDVKSINDKGSNVVNPIAKLDSQLLPMKSPIIQDNRIWLEESYQNTTNMLEFKEGKFSEIYRTDAETYLPSCNEKECYFVGEFPRNPNIIHLDRTSGELSYVTEFENRKEIWLIEDKFDYLIARIDGELYKINKNTKLISETLRGFNYISGVKFSCDKPNELYFSSSVQFEAIYKYNIETEIAEMLIPKGSVPKLDCLNKKLYYRYQEYKKAPKLVKSELDGSNREEIAIDDFDIRFDLYWDVHDGKLALYSTNGEMYKLLIIENDQLQWYDLDYLLGSVQFGDDGTLVTYSKVPTTTGIHTYELSTWNTRVLIWFDEIIYNIRENLQRTD